MRKIFKEITRLNEVTKKMITVGIFFSLVTLFAGTLLICINGTIIPYDPYVGYIAPLIASKSFPILAEVIIGCIIIDYLFNR